jgi:DNA (cytosine-5)-methyltransferase 1
MKVGTFFSGIGSPEQALLNLGVNHEIEFACDIDKYARETYLKNFDCKNMYQDITALDMKDLSYVDLLVFGFPCQAFSMAGKRGGFEDTRGTLFYDALRYLKEHKPRYFIAENVKGLLSHDSGKTFQIIIDCLALTTNTQMSLMPFDNLGYHIYYKVLNTKDFGIPQNRERIFIVGIRDDADNNFRFPKEIQLKLKLKDILQDNPNYAKSGLYQPYPRNYKELGLERKEQLEIRKDNISNTITTSNDQIIKIDDKYYLSDKASDKIKIHNNKSNKKASIFQNKQYIKTHSLYPRSGNPKKGGTGHLSKSDGTSYCLDTGNAQAIEKNNKIRKLTPIECERLQGFPDNHTEGVSDTQRYKQCGNSITVNVMEAILKNLINGYS